MKTTKIINKSIISEDRIRKFMLSSLFCVLIGSCGCGSAVTMHKASEKRFNDDKSIEVQEMDSENAIESNFYEENEVNFEEKEAQNEKNLIKVHVCGAVYFPGVYELESDSRVIDAVEMAGGFTENACGEAVNLAAMLEDSCRIYIPNEEEMTGVEKMQVGSFYTENGIAGISNNNGTAGSSNNKSNGKVNINTAGEEQLQTITGIGASRAKSIIEYRQNNGRFNKIEDIQNVSGIGKASFEKMKDMISVD